MTSASPVLDVALVQIAVFGFVFVIFPLVWILRRPRWPAKAERGSVDELCLGFWFLLMAAAAQIPGARPSIISSTWWHWLNLGALGVPVFASGWYLSRAFLVRHQQSVLNEKM